MAFPESDSQSQKFDLGEELLSTTLDQLHTLLAVAEHESVREAGKKLGKDQSSVDKQIDALTKHFGRLMPGIKLVIKSEQRGGKVQFTEPGKLVVALAKTILEQTESTRLELTRLQGQVKAAATTFMIPAVCVVWNEWKRVAGSDFQLSITHIHSDRVPSILLEDSTIDFCFGGLLTGPQGFVRSSKELQQMEFIEWDREEIGILTNLPDSRLGGGPISVEEIISRNLPLILPTQGMVADFAEMIFHGEQVKANIIEFIHDVFFGVNLLQYEIYPACMFCTDTIAKWAMSSGLRSATSDQSAPNVILRYIPLTASSRELKASVGLFRRKEAKAYGKDHPLTICWEKFKEMAQVREQNNKPQRREGD